MNSNPPNRMLKWRIQKQSAIHFIWSPVIIYQYPVSHDICAHWLSIGIMRFII